MLQKIKSFLLDHPKEYELLRYLMAGVLTTLLSMAVFALFCMVVSADHTINGATSQQALIGNVISWIIAVLFAFWINRYMVFQRRGGQPSAIAKELGQFVASRLISGLLFEILLFGLMLDVLHISNIITKLVTLVLVTIFNYIVSKFWVFSKKEAPTDSNPR